MPGILSTRTTAIAVVLLLIAGYLLTRYLGRRMGDARRSERSDVNRILGDLATTMSGRFEDGGKLSDHPLLGEVRRYGTAHVTHGQLAIAVGVSYPADDLRDDRTTVRIQRPAERRWRVAKLHQRGQARARNDPGGPGDTEKVAAELARTFEISGGEPLPLEVRQALLHLGARTFSIDVGDDALEVIAVPDGNTVYIADPARLRAFVEEVVRVADALLVPAAA
jgi:hypothetical protein